MLQIPSIALGLAGNGSEPDRSRVGSRELGVRSRKHRLAHTADPAVKPSSNLGSLKPQQNAMIFQAVARSWKPRLPFTGVSGLMDQAVRNVRWTARGLIRQSVIGADVLQVRSRLSD